MGTRFVTLQKCCLFNLMFVFFVFFFFKCILVGLADGDCFSACNFCFCFLFLALGFSYCLADGSELIGSSSNRGISFHFLYPILIFFKFYFIFLSYTFLSVPLMDLF